MDRNHLNNFEREPTKNHSCEVCSKANRWFKMKCRLKTLLTDGRTDKRTQARRTKCDQKSSSCHCFTGKPKKTLYKDSDGPKQHSHLSNLVKLSVVHFQNLDIIHNIWLNAATILITLRRCVGCTRYSLFTITETRLFKYIENFTSKTENF